MKNDQLGPLSKRLERVSVLCFWVMLSRAQKKLHGKEDGTNEGWRFEQFQQLLEAPHTNAEMLSSMVARSYLGNYNLFDLATGATASGTIEDGKVFALTRTLEVLRWFLGERQELLAALLDWFANEAAQSRSELAALQRATTDLLTASVERRREEVLS